jgi:cytochrome c oxidase accessory protein FixG
MSKVEAKDKVKPAAPESSSLYAEHRKVYPKAVGGTVRRAKWLILSLCLGLYYLVPWLRWDRGPGAPDQAVLVDMHNARLYFLWVEIWPQEVYYLTGLLILGAIGLFMATSLFGRVWCGFTCPQTVWTDLFMLVERWIQGDRNARMKLDQQPMSAGKFLKKVATHAVWLLIAAATGGAWIMYFQDAPTLVRELFTGQSSTGTYFFFGLFTATTYVFAGWAREQLCIYMCPWPRFQAAMLDENSLVVAYRDWRGEPRGKAKAEGVGDCVDCAACVNVCPTGIDIREGIQMACIGCGLCIDACDDIMGRLDRPKGLIGFETWTNLDASTKAAAPFAPGPARQQAGMAARRVPRFIRARTLVYLGVLAAVAGVMLGSYVMRTTLTLAVIRERAPLFVRLSDGGVRNAYVLKLANKLRSEEQYAVLLEGPRGLSITVQDAPQDAQGHPLIGSRADGITQWRALVTAPPGLHLDESVGVHFRLLDAEGHAVTSTGSVFLGPKP